MLFKKILDPAFKKSWNTQFRKNRFKLSESMIASFPPGKVVNILDVGGTESYWENMEFTDASRIKITRLNLSAGATRHSNFVSIAGDATRLQFPDNHFDVVHSNSVIEHLFTKDAQKLMAAEIRRVSTSYYVQTPNYFFPIEPHWLFPFFQFLPFKLRVLLTKNFDLGHYKKSVTTAAATERVREVRLLTEREMTELFPDGQIHREIFWGLKKSIVSYRLPA